MPVVSSFNQLYIRAVAVCYCSHGTIAALALLEDFIKSTIQARASFQGPYWCYWWWSLSVAEVSFLASRLKSELRSTCSILLLMPELKPIFSDFSTWIHSLCLHTEQLSHWQKLTMVAEPPLLLIGRYVARVGRWLTGAVEVAGGSRPLKQVTAGQRCTALKLEERHTAGDCG